jgi:hypothetical protein
VKVVPAERVLASVEGSEIEGSELDEDTLSIFLSDGRTLVFAGEFAIAVVNTRRTLQ